MDDLFKRANKYSMLEDDIRAATQEVLVTNRPTRNNHARSSKSLNQLRQANKGQDDQQQLNQASLTPQYLMKNFSQWFAICLILGDQSRSRQIRLNGIEAEGVPITNIMDIAWSSAEVSTI